jgi:hypothetical protein
LAAKIEFSYGAVQTVNLLALRLQWFESTPVQIAYSQLVTQLSTALLSADFGHNFMLIRRIVALKFAAVLQTPQAEKGGEP